jgi:hypothetical protein
MHNLHSDIIPLIVRDLNIVDKIMLKLTCKRFNGIIPRQFPIMHLTTYCLQLGYSCLCIYLLKNLTGITIRFLYDSVEMAIKYNNVTVLQYCHLELNYEIRPYNCQQASFDGSLDILRYLIKNGIRLKSSCYSAPCILGNLEMLAFLHENGCKFGKSFKYGVQYSDEACIIQPKLDVVKFLCENGCPFNREILCYVRDNEIREYLVSKEFLEFALIEYH